MAALKGKALHVRQLRLIGDYDGIKNHLALNQAALDAREGDRRVSRAARIFIMTRASWPASAPGSASSRIALDMPGIFAQPVGFQSLQFDGDYQLASPHASTSRAPA